MKWKYWRIELGFVIAVLIVLLAVMLPRFLKVQVGGQVNQIQNDLAIITEAIQAYINDHGYAPEVFTDGSMKYAYLTGFQPEFEYIHAAANYDEFIDYISNLTGQGYIDQLPSTVQDARKFGSMHVSFVVFHLYGGHRSPNKGQTENWGIAVYWPNVNKDLNQWVELHPNPYPPAGIDHTDLKADFGYKFQRKKLSELISNNATEEEIDIAIETFSKVQRDFTIPLIDPVYVYHPTNGLESAGFVYVDTKGHRLP